MHMHMVTTWLSLPGYHPASRLSTWPIMQPDYSAAVAKDALCPDDDDDCGLHDWQACSLQPAAAATCPRPHLQLHLQLLPCRPGTPAPLEALAPA